MIKEIIFHGRELRKNNRKNLINKADMTYAISNFNMSRIMKETKEQREYLIDFYYGVGYSTTHYKILRSDIFNRVGNPFLV